MEAVVAAQPAAPLAFEEEFSPALRGGAWVAVAVLGLLAGWASLAPISPAAPQAGVVSLGALQLESLEAREVENAWVGPIWVVSGELHNPTSAPQPVGGEIVVSLLDSGGDALDGATAVAVPSLPADRLREDDPTRAGAGTELAAAELASQPLAPGARVPVDAVFAAPARGAARFEVESRPLRTPPPAAKPLATPATDSAAAPAAPTN